MAKKVEYYLPVIKQARGYYSAYPIYAPITDNGGQVFNVANYGKLGTANDTAVIQSALNAAFNNGGGEVLLPPGKTYLIDPNPGLQVKSNTVFNLNGSTLKLINGSTKNDNLVKSESWTNVTIMNGTVDGNRTNQAGSPGSYTYTQYGVYFGTTTNSLVWNVRVKNMTGVGIHVYNGTQVVVSECVASSNNYHGFEFEQDTECSLIASRGTANLLHGVLTSPGEVAGTGSKGNSFIGNKFDANQNYGIAMNAANGDVSAFLNEGNVYTGNTIINNSFYGVNFYKQDKHVFSNNYVSGNGYFGLYAFQSSNNVVTDNIFVNNSQASNGGYDEILVEGNSSGHAAVNNIISGNTILITGATKSRYAINEATSSDGSNTIYGNNIPSAGTSGRLNILSTTTSAVDRLNGVGIAANATLSGAQMGIDAPFGTGALRMYNNNSGGNAQFVTPNGQSDWYAGGNNIMTANSGGVLINAGYTLQTPKLKVVTGANANAGTGTLTGGTVTIATTAVTASSLVFLTDTTNSLTNLGTLTVASISAGASFTVKSSNALDTSTFNWLIIN